MSKLRTLGIASALSLMAIAAIAQPPGIKKKPTPAPEDTFITSDTLAISYDTTKVRYILYCSDCSEPDTYLYFRNGYMITKIFRSKNPQQKPVGIPTYFYKDWAPVKIEDAFDVREYPWRK